MDKVDKKVDKMDRALEVDKMIKKNGQGGYGGG